MKQFLRELNNECRIPGDPLVHLHNIVRQYGLTEVSAVFSADGLTETIRYRDADGGSFEAALTASRLRWRSA